MTFQLTAPSLRSRALAWIDADPDPITRAELLAIVEHADEAELAERVGSALTFGTAGLRGLVGAGPNRMNLAVVLRTTRGLASFLLSRQLDARHLPVIVGFDARPDSRRFAEQAAGVLAAAGLEVRFFAEPVPTPLVAFVARQLAAVAAIVVTASHNPAPYNGYKVYGPSAVQIAPPLDEQIGAFIERVGAAREVPMVPAAFSTPHERIARVSDALVERYFMQLGSSRPVRPGAPLRIAYTPLHGVGWSFARRALDEAGYSDVHVVAEQAQPDGAFPTTPFPNPEEPGVLDRVSQLGETVNAELILAHDPDADRLAVVVPTPAGRFVPLSGNEVGVLLADFLLEHATCRATPLIVSSIVSSPMLERVAHARGARVERTLTGFKWIWSAALELERSGFEFVLGYEEALGYSVGGLVRDKDGISAGVLFADLAARAKAQGKSVREQLHELYRRHGLWVSVQRSVVRPGIRGLSRIADALQQLLTNPPERLGESAVLRLTNYAVGGEQRPRWLPNTDMVGLDLEGSARVLVRPSGTEPKLKIYVDLCVALDDGAAVSAREADARSRAEGLADALVRYLGLTTTEE